jgi:phage replication-related protein YjqB (UPF0714/DUF867 family)
MKNPFEDLAITVSFHGGGIANATTVAAPALASEVVKAAFYGLLQMGYAPDSILDEFQNLLEEHRGLEFMEFEEGDDEPV